MAKMRYSKIKILLICLFLLFPVIAHADLCPESTYEMSSMALQYLIEKESPNAIIMYGETFIETETGAKIRMNGFCTNKFGVPVKRQWTLEMICRYGKVKKAFFTYEDYKNEI